MSAIDSILEKIRNAKPLDFGTIFNNSIELFKKTWLQGFLLQLFVMVISLPLIIILYVPFIIMMISQTGEGYYESDSVSTFFAGFSILYILFFIVGILIIGAIQLALNAAFFRIMRNLDDNKPVTTSDFFYFLKGKHLSKVFLLMLASVLISAVAGFLAILASIPTLFLSFLIFLYLVVPMSFFTVFFAFNPELNVGDIVKASFKFGNKKLLLAFGLIFVSSLLATIVGGLLCGIGTLFTSAFVYHPVYLMYKEIIGFQDTYIIDTIGDQNE